MKWFLKMAEIAQKEKMIDVSEIISDCVPFVFSCKNAAVEEIPDIPTDDILAAPFSCFSIEMAQGHPLCSPKAYDHPIYIQSLLVAENGPDDYTLYALATWPNRSGYPGFSLSEIPKENTPLHALVRVYIQRIHAEASGNETVRKVFKSGTGKSQKKHTIKRVVHITPKKFQSGSHPCQSGRKINWSHSWLTRGHWRQVKNIGKDRAGNYCIDGYTFVVPHEKGQGVIIRKTRIVEK